MKNPNNVIVLTHPLLKHKISMMRDKNTGTAAFRGLVEELTLLMAYEALASLPTELVEVDTPLEKCMTPMISGRKLCVVPILRAGLGMAEGIVRLVPSARIGHIGMYRDPETHRPVEYYCKLPEHLDERMILVVDPMLATGGSAVDAVSAIKAHGGKNIKLLNIIAAPEGVETFNNAHPDVPVYIGNIDRGMNENKYILPGLGDAGDRIFGTK
ncbi:MAG: uracil phosphoribosyltransferase [Synergistes sp.]|nr:uracil phosphoribosyltransferase [Synergistes sp.]